MRDTKTHLWWSFLRGVSVINILILAWVCWTVDFSAPYRFPHVCLAAIYTFVCAFRSFFPRVDLERTVLVDHWLSNIVLGRSSATLAEMCFTAQLTLVLIESASVVPWLWNLGVVLLPLIAIAQITCWLGVLTGNHLWHALEEALWSLLVCGMIGAGIALWPFTEGIESILLGLGFCGAAGTIWVMSGNDVPMYIHRWRQETADGKTFVAPLTGFKDALHRREPTGDWSVWRHEVPWMTPYFSVGVWLSLFLARVPFGLSH